MDLHLSDYLNRNAGSFPDKPALITETHTLTWKQLQQAVELAAKNLTRYLPPSVEQSIVGLVMPNTSDYVITYLAIIDAGHIALPIDVIYKPLEIEAIIKQINPVLVVADSANMRRLQNSTGAAGLIAAEELRKPAQNNLHRLPRQSADKQVASLLFTSGTTGRPKASAYTHTNHTWNIKTCSEAWGWDDRDTLLVSLRLTHMHGLIMGLTGALYHGNTMYLQENFDAKETLKVLASGEISIFTHGPVAYERMLAVNDADRYDLSGVRLMISGSAPLSPKIWRQFKQKFGQEILEVYGTTETGRIASNLPTEKIPGSPGRPLPDVRLKFSSHGEVMVKSPGVIPGYYKNSAATRAATATGGWWKTGDLGHLEGGRLVLKGRLHERISRFGYIISPRDVEWALHKEPGIREAFVLGVQRQGSTDDELVYFLSGDVNEEQVRDFCKVNMPSIWRPDKIILLDQLPRGHGGKLEISKFRAMVN